MGKAEQDEATILETRPAGQRTISSKFIKDITLGEGDSILKTKVSVEIKVKPIIGTDFFLVERERIADDPSKNSQPTIATRTIVTDQTGADFVRREKVASQGYKSIEKHGCLLNEYCLPTPEAFSILFDGPGPIDKNTDFNSDDYYHGALHGEQILDPKEAIQSGKFNPDHLIRDLRFDTGLVWKPGQEMPVTHYSQFVIKGEYFKVEELAEHLKNHPGIASAEVLEPYALSRNIKNIRPSERKFLEIIYKVDQNTYNQFYNGFDGDDMSFTDEMEAFLFEPAPTWGEAVEKRKTSPFKDYFGVSNFAKSTEEKRAEDKGWNNPNTLV